MRIQRLSFDFFGQFTDKPFDFGKSDGPSDFHIIYGPNEAGKTTAMEGYLRLLYGFPLREPYGFQHQRSNLQVSGLLEINGEARSFTRLPSRSGNLRGDAGATLPETALASHLGGLSLEDYRSLLCLDDETIEKGGDDIASARGDIGRLLFSAAAGVADLNAVLEQAQDEANGLYKKGGSKNRVAEIKRQLAEVERQIKDLDINANAWRKLKEALQTAENEETQAKEARDTLHLELAQISAMRRALPKLGGIDQLLPEIVEFADYPDKLDVNSEDLVALKTHQMTAQAELQRLTDEIGKAQQELGKLVLDEDRLSLAARLDELDELRSRTQTAALDLPRRRAAYDEALADMTRIARELGTADESKAPSLVKAPADIASLESLRNAMSDAIAAKEAEEREIRRLQGRATAAQEDHQSLLDNAPVKASLIELLTKFDVDSLAPAEATAKQAIASSSESFQDMLSALSIGEQAFDKVPDYPVDQTEADELAKQHIELTDKITHADETISRFEEDVAVKTAQIGKLEANIGAMSDEDARQARERRDTLWRDHRSTLSAETADAFEPSMKQVDGIDGTRINHAKELGELRQLEQALVEAETRLATTQQNRDGFRLQSKTIESRVEELAATIGLPILSPTRFRDWVELRGLAAAAKKNHEKLAQQHRETLHQAKQLHEALLPLLPLEAPSFEAALVAARRLAEEERDHKNKVQVAFEKKAALERELEGRHLDLAALDDAADKAIENWTAKVHELFEGTVPSDVLESAIGQLRDIREHDAKLQQAARQISSMESDQRQFLDAITTLNAEFDVDESDPLKAFRMLQSIGNKAQADKIQYDVLSTTIAEDQKKHKEVEAQLLEVELQVTELGALFPATTDTSTLDALRITAGTSANIIQTRAQIADLEKQIFAELSVHAVADARNMLGEETAATLEAKSASLEADLELAETRLSNATVARANAERDLSTVTGNAEVAELVEQRTTLQLEIEDALLNYAERDFGLRLAEEAIRRYRDKHRSGMMDATERAFSDLTNGAYQKLLTQPDGSSEILLAVDANGTPKQISDMSKGTRFQLYLALRAAAYEQMVSQGVQLPFFCDDVFETFDEDRTRAACRLMERIGRSGQAIYLTHHRHVVEIAKEVCDLQLVIHTI
jgi:uncharacterized protein YhaN